MGTKRIISSFGQSRVRLSSYDMERLQKVRALIDTNVARHHSIREIALYAGMSTTKLKDGFKELYGMGLYHYLKKQRLEKGKYLIENTDKTLWEISRSLGYKHVCNFITAFKKEFGKSPGLWRSRLIMWLIHFYYLEFFF